MSTNGTTDVLLVDLSRKMNVLISLSLRQLMQDQKLGGKGKRKQGVGEQARYLAAMGLNAKDIADITGAAVSSIRTLLTPSRSR